MTLTSYLTHGARSRITVMRNKTVGETLFLQAPQVVETQSSYAYESSAVVPLQAPGSLPVQVAAEVHVCKQHNFA